MESPADPPVQHQRSRLEHVHKNGDKIWNSIFYNDISVTYQCDSLGSVFNTMLWQCCDDGLVRFWHRNHLVREMKSLCFGFWFCSPRTRPDILFKNRVLSPRTQLEGSQHVIWNIQFRRHRLCLKKCPDVSLKTSSGFMQSLQWHHHRLQLLTWKVSSYTNCRTNVSVVLQKHIMTLFYSDDWAVKCQ